MDHGRDLPGQDVAPHQLVKAVAVQIVHIAAFDQIAPFLAAGQIVHHHDFVQIHAVQLPEQSAADKARAAGDHIHKSLRKTMLAQSPRGPQASGLGFSHCSVSGI